MTDLTSEQGAGWPRRLVVIAVALAIPLTAMATARGNLFPQFHLHAQDLPVLAGLIALLVILSRWVPRWTLPEVALSRRSLLALAVAAALLLWGGTYLVMGNFPLSRDEHMVVFDMAVFAKGHLAEPLAPQWRAYAEVLVPAFLLNTPAPAGMVSAYLPGNPMLRLGISTFADPALMNPLLAGIGAIALYDIAQRLFAGDRRAVLVALIVYALSAQMWVGAMTAYAMTAHMALNLVWLALFLRGGRAHLAAIAVGFVAVGLHQLAFHPIFAAPFVAWRLFQGQWRLAVLYAFGYAAILGFWIGYPLVAAMQAGAAQVGGSPNDSFWQDRVLPLLISRDPLTVPLMILNLLRFVAWQHLAFVPLVVAALPLALRNREATAPLFGGILIALMLFTLVLPFQGHGWGYRYLHGFLGSFAVLAGYGYRRLAAMERVRTDGIFIVLTAATLLCSAPWLVWRAYDFVAPHVALERQIAARTSTMVLIDTDDIRQTIDGRWTENAIDHVRNSPDLTNRPLRLSSRMLGPAALQELCRRGTISLVTRADMHRLGFSLGSSVSNPEFDALVGAIKDRPCLVRGT